MSKQRPATGIVHLGLGAFYRAFGCIYVADAMKATGGNWGILGVSLRNPDTRNALRSQNWAYTSVSMHEDGERCRTVDVLNNVLVAPEDPAAVINAMANPEVKIVTLTVTEKGYCHNPATGNLISDHADVQHDISNALPVSAPGFLVRALQKRLAAGIAPFTVLSCDNLPDNGKLVRGVVLQLAHQIDTRLYSWIEEYGRFPSTMVDRITPATTAADIARVAELTGINDVAPVMHEPFSQWVVEDNFVEDLRPDFAAAGVELVQEVTAHEHMKLRMLNGTHSALAYTGYLAAHETIADTMADPAFVGYVKGLWAEIIPTVHAPSGVNLNDYSNALFERYNNKNIRHRTWQIAMDGSQKLPQRILDTLHENIESGRNSPCLCLAVAGWMRYVSGVDEYGQPIDIRDPLASKLQQVVANATTPVETVSSLLAMEEIFSPDIVEKIREPLNAAAVRLWVVGARRAVHELCYE